MTSEIFIPILILLFMLAPTRFENLIYGVKRRDRYLASLKSIFPDIPTVVEDLGFQSIKHFIRCAVGKSSRGNLIYLDPEKKFGVSIHLLKGIGTAAVYFINIPCEQNFFLWGKSLSDLFSGKNRPDILSRPAVMPILLEIAELPYFRYLSFENKESSQSLVQGRLNPRNLPGIYLVFHPIPGSLFWGETLLKAEHIAQIVPLVKKLAEEVT